MTKEKPATTPFKLTVFDLTTGKRSVSVALQSKLFRGDPKLEAAAVLDSAHITIGARGEHVRKIQYALTVLDGVNIAQDGAYGAETAAAVLAYKRKRNIINRSYQTQADDIVGKSRANFARSSSSMESTVRNR